jgi:hypothetical protein
MPPRYRVCAEPGCPNYTDGHTRCADCRSAHEQARGTRTARGYGPDHQAAKRQLQAEGHTHCTRCHQPFTPANPMDTGHLVPIRDGGTAADGVAPHCASCNRGWRATGL